MSKKPDFEWDNLKDRENQRKHGVPFALAQLAFVDPDRIILEDIDHSTKDENDSFALEWWQKVS